MKKYNILFVLLAAIVLLPACGFFHTKHKAGTVVELNGNYLYEQDLQQITKGLQGEDSAQVADRYIQQWASDILVYDEARDRAKPEIEALVEDYRRSLYVHDFQQRYIAQRMPVLVADTLVEQFYQSHSAQFLLKQCIVKGILIVVPNEAPKMDKLRKWLQSPNEKDNLENLERYAYGYATGYELFLDQWRTEADILTMMPFSENDLERVLRDKKQIECRDSVSTYILQVTEKHMASEQMPLDYARPEIEKIILSQRQVEYIERQRNQLYRDAIRYNKIKFYDEKTESFADRVADWFGRFGS